MNSRERTQLTPPLLDFVRVINRREGDLIEAMVPLSLVYSEDVPVDAAHVDNLRTSIQQEERLGKVHGQLIPLLLGEVRGFRQLPIIDGFHRLAALRMLEKPEAFATIRTDSTWEDVYDLRILSAATHRSVRFARVVEWVGDAWKYSPWSDQLRVSQAFALHFVPGMTGSRLGLNPEDAEQVKEWVERKCEQWHIPPRSIYQHLLITHGADPKLVRLIRERQGRQQINALTPRHLDAVAKVLPFMYELQMIAAQAVVENNLGVHQAEQIAGAIRYANSKNEALSIIKRRLPGIVGEPRLPQANRVSIVYSPRVERVDPIEIARQRRLAFYKYLELAEQSSKLTGKPINEIVQKDATERGIEVNFVANGQIIDKRLLESEEDQKPLEHRLETPLGELIHYPDRNIAVSPLLPERTPVQLTPTESKILDTLFSNPAKVFSHRKIAEAIWGQDSLDGVDHVIRVNMVRLRKKLGDSGIGRLIYTISGAGFTLTPNPQ